MAKNNRQTFGLDCKDCGNRNYVTTKNTINSKDKLELNKFCRHCRKVTTHNESRKLH